MSLVVIVLTLAVAAGRDAIVQRTRPLAAHLGTISGWILIVAGAFIVWYWATVLASGATALSGSPVVRVIDRLTAAVAVFVSTNPAVALIGLLLVGLGARWWITRSRETVAGPDSPAAVSDRHLADDVSVPDRRDGERPQIP